MMVLARSSSGRSMSIPVDRENEFLVQDFLLPLSKGFELSSCQGLLSSIHCGVFASFPCLVREGVIVSLCVYPVTFCVVCPPSVRECDPKAAKTGQLWWAF